MFASPDQPRFDHDVLTGESKGLLIEESRTNLIAYSQQIEKQSASSTDHNVWIVSGSSSNALLDLNASIAPDGTLSASKIYADIPSKSCTIYQQVYTTDTTPETLTFSVFAKAGQANRYLQFFLGSGDVDGNPFVNFNLFDGTVSRDDDLIGSIVDVGNGWYRCIITFTTTSSIVTFNPVICLIDDDNAGRAVSMIGDGYSGIYIWGAQLEEGSFATSYIKTSGASATRSADNASITGENFSSWYRQDEGSFEIDASLLSVSQSQTGRFITISDGSTNNRIQIDNNNTTLNFYIAKNGSAQALSQWNRESVLDYKFAFALKENDVAFCKNNESIFSDSSVNLFFANKLDIKNENDGLEQLNGHIKKLSYYPQRLTNEQLQQLTK